MKGRNFAYFRLSGESVYTVVSSDRTEPLTCLLVSEGQGFAVAPFTESDTAPALFIPADEVVTEDVPERGTEESSVSLDENKSADSEYSFLFNKFHGEVMKGRFDKLVLSRKRVWIPGGEVDVIASFFRACRLYPHLTVILLSTEKTGTWLISSPEPLLEYADGEFHTVALAGTMPDEGVPAQWSEKNCREQQIVSQFITASLTSAAGNVRIDGPHTFGAGNLIHLKTDISFNAPSDRVGEIAARLHPTPAVCGLPQKEAKEFILENEGYDRRYYSGFSGPVGIGGRTALYVSLRCASVSSEGKSVTLYAGGGIMPESGCRSEFLETENKMQTISKCIVTRKM